MAIAQPHLVGRGSQTALYLIDEGAGLLSPKIVLRQYARRALIVRYVEAGYLGTIRLSIWHQTKRLATRQTHNSAAHLPSAVDGIHER
jgi:hypothetical protein